MRVVDSSSVQFRGLYTWGKGPADPCLYISLSWDLMCHTSSAYKPLMEIMKCG